MACPLRLEVSATDTPDDWDVVGDGFTKVTAVQTFDRDDSYIVSTGADTSQWYQVENVPGGQDTTTTIHAVRVTACFKSDDPTATGGLRIDLRVGDDSVGANDQYSRCDYSCVTETFDLNPNVDPPAAFTWADIDNIEVGVTSRATGETRVSKLYVDVICGDLWRPCPRCCCCCMCFTPTLRWTGIVFGDGFTPEVGDVTVNVPYKSTYIDGGCHFYINEDDYDLPVLLGTSTYGCGEGCTGSCSLYLNGASIVSTVTETPGCSFAQMQLLRVCEQTGEGQSSTTYTANVNQNGGTQLHCCSPHHFSTSDSITFDEILTCGVGVLECGQFEIECLDMVGDVSIGEDCLPLE